MFNMNKNLKGTTEFAGSYACSTTVLAYKFGPAANAFVRCPLEQIDDWCQVWAACSSGDRHDSRHSWQRHLTTYLTTHKCLNSMGPVAGTINAVLRAGWRPSRPDRWQIDAAT